MKYLIVPFIFFASLSTNLQSQQTDITAIFKRYGVEGCFILQGPRDTLMVKYNPARCDSGFLPASTFKIPHAVIALEEGLISDTSEIIPWNGKEWPHSSWNSDQNLRTAIQNSCIWVFIDFAARAGIETYHSYLKAFDYGNQDLSGPPTRFWLGGPFNISANEQIEFLKKFYYYQLPVSKESIQQVKPLLIIEESPGFTWSGKTGSGRISDTEWIFWLVGYLEKEGTPYFYAMNFTGSDLQKLGAARHKISRAVFQELHLLPQE